MAEAQLQVNPEQAKYEQMWALEQYRRYAPGETLTDEFLRFACPAPGATVIDFGTGTGRGALNLHRAGCKVTMLDFAANCLDEEVRAHVGSGAMDFLIHDLLNESPVKADFGYCTDVMEHIEPEGVDAVISNILDAVGTAFFQISLEHDACGQLIGEHLHLTVQPMEWWVRKMRQHNAFIYFSDKRGENAIFYVSKVEHDGTKLNTELDVILRNIKINVAKGYTQLVPHAKSHGKVMLLGGGPSLNHFKNEIRRRAANTPVICTNGTYNWCLDAGISPKALIVVDARPSNAKFVQEAIPSCKYMFASQCDPLLFESAPFDQTYIWHSHIPEVLDETLDESYGTEMWHSVPGGTTVMLRAVPLLGMLGWKDIDIYGFDGCLQGEDHHAYEQTENEGFPITTVTIEGDEFLCHPWMVVQGQEFEKLYKATKGSINWNIRGPGLIKRLVDLIEKPKRVKT